MVHVKHKISLWRLISQISAFVFFNSMIFGVPSVGGIIRSFFIPSGACRYLRNAPTYCYLYDLQQALTGGFENLYIQIIVPLLIFVLLVVIIGRSWCAWICPLGFVQDLLVRLRRTLGIPYLDLSYRTHASLKAVKYAFLFFVLLIAFSIGFPYFGWEEFRDILSLPYCQVCPSKPLFLILQQMVGIEPTSTVIPIIAIIFLIIFFVTAFFIRMFWCRICPIGALMSPLNKTSVLWLRKNHKLCTKCRICLRACPMDINRIYEESEKGDVTYADCTLCLKCVEACPENDCLSLTFFKWTIVKSRRWG